MLYWDPSVGFGWDPAPDEVWPGACQPLGRCMEMAQSVSPQAAPQGKLLETGYSFFPQLGSWWGGVGGRLGQRASVELCSGRSHRILQNPRLRIVPWGTVALLLLAFLRMTVGISTLFYHVCLLGCSRGAHWLCLSLWGETKGTRSPFLSAIRLTFPWR